MLRFFAIILFILRICSPVLAQKTGNDTIRVWATVVDNDTLPTIFLSPAYVMAQRLFASHRKEVEYTKLRRDVLKVLPYARLAGEKYKELERKLEFVHDERLQKALTKRTEQEIKDQFFNELKDLTITQGRILIRLIDRETGHTSYTILKEFRGNLSAFFWQGLARICGSNLKWEYDPDVERDIESIIRSADEQDFIYKVQK